MLSNNIFRISLLISLSLHMLVIAPWQGFNLNHNKLNNNIEVYYIAHEEVNEKELETIPHNYDLEKKEIELFKNNNEDEKMLYDGIKEDIVSLSKDSQESVEEYIQYYELIRECIKKEALNYSNGDRKIGEVTAVFMIDSSGTLLDIKCLPDKSTEDIYLIDCALKSIKSASPFPTFPEKLNLDNLTFELTVVFKN